MTARDELAARMRPICADAVDDMEIAAVLESDGITDALAVSRYGATDVFDLAQRLRRDTPQRPQATALAASPWQSDGFTHLLRGVLFALPALCYVAVSDQVKGWRSAAVLVVSVLLSWAASQLLAYLGYVRLGGQDRTGSARVLRGGLLVGTVVVLTGTVAVGLGLGVSAGVLLVAGAQVFYLLAATVALVLGRQWWLLAALTPGVIAVGIGLALGGAAVRSSAVVGATATTVLACLVVAVLATRGARPGVPTRAELLAAAPHALFGVGVGALLLYVPASRSLLNVPAGAYSAAGLAALVPLSLSMGFAEWLLIRYRGWTHRALQQARTITGFALRSGAALVAAVTAYVAALAVACAVAAQIVRGVSGRPVHPVGVLGYLALGAALFLTLLLVTFRLRAVAIAACALTVVVELVALDSRYAPEILQLAATTLLSAGLCGYALFALGRATRHL